MPLSWSRNKTIALVMVPLSAMVAFAIGATGFAFLWHWFSGTIGAGYLLAGLGLIALGILVFLRGGDKAPTPFRYEPPPTVWSLMQMILARCFVTIQGIACGSHLASFLLSSIGLSLPRGLPDDPYQAVVAVGMLLVAMIFWAFGMARNSTPFLFDSEIKHYMTDRSRQLLRWR